MKTLQQKKDHSLAEYAARIRNAYSVFLEADTAYTAEKFRARNEHVARIKEINAQEAKRIKERDEYEDNTHNENIVDQDDYVDHLPTYD